jgi:PTH1 family peptidyl-tRNA hydrolase
MSIIIVGLGNPGEKFKNTPHNVGFLTVEAFAKENNFPDFEAQKMFEAELSRGEIFGKEIVLAKPQTFMNNSGIAVKRVLGTGNELVVVHDDIDLPLGTIKLSKNRGAGGHKGVESIINHLGTEDFSRLRIGIQPAKGKPKAAEKYVLKKFGKKDLEILKSVLEKSVTALNLLVEQGLEKAMNATN